MPNSHYECSVCRNLDIKDGVSVGNQSPPCKIATFSLDNSFKNVCLIDAGKCATWKPVP